MNGDLILGCWSRKTSHYSSHHCNNDSEISEEECLGVSSSGEFHEHRSLDTSHSTSSNHIVSVNSYFYTSHSSSTNYGGYVGRGGSISQEASHCSSRNQRKVIDVEGRCGYRSRTCHYSSHIQVEYGILFTSPLDTVCFYGRVLYRSHTIYYSSQRVDSRGDGEKH